MNKPIPPIKRPGQPQTPLGGKPATHIQALEQRTQGLRVILGLFLVVFVAAGGYTAYIAWSQNIPLTEALLTIQSTITGKDYSASHDPTQLSPEDEAYLEALERLNDPESAPPVKKSPGITVSIPEPTEDSMEEEMTEKEPVIEEEEEPVVEEEPVSETPSSTTGNIPPPPPPPPPPGGM